MSSRASPQTSPRKGKYLQCRVYMLDDVWQVFQVPIKALGQALFAEVVRKLQLLEMDYFDLEFTDRINSNGTPCWLDHEKPVLKQVSNQDLSFKFLVKFYTPDPGLLEEEYTRYLFALQVRRDLATGAMPCQEHTAVLLASYVVQAEIGDFLEDEYLDHSYLSHLKLLPNQNRDLEIKIMEHHKEHIGQTPAEADFNLLDTARKVELYGIRVHSAKDHEGVPLNLAVAHMGVLVYQNYTKINTFSWAKIRKLSFKRKKFLIKLHPEGYGYYKDTVEFYFESRNDCKNFWKKCIEHHAFFRCQQVKRLPRNRTRVVSRGSSFRYAGRTQKQLTEYVRENYIKRPPFERTMSQRTVASVNRSHATTPNTGTLNSRDIHFGGHNTSASSGSHILEMNSSSRDRLDGLGSRVETAEVHDDSSQSGSRSINSPKRDRERDFSQQQQQQQLQGSQEWHQQQQQYHEKDGQAPHDMKGPTVVERSPRAQRIDPTQFMLTKQDRKLSAPVFSHLVPPEVDDKSLSRSPEIENIPEKVQESKETREEKLRHISTSPGHVADISGISSLSTFVNGNDPERASSPNLQRLRGTGQIEAPPPTYHALYANMQSSPINEEPLPPPPPPIFHDETPREKLKGARERREDMRISSAATSRSTMSAASFTLTSSASVTSSRGTDESEEESRRKVSDRRRYPVDKAYYIAKELLMTERTYKKDLEVITVWFRNAVQKEEVLPEPLGHLLFANLEPIYEFHCSFLKEIEQRLAMWEGKSNAHLNGDYQKIGDIMLNNMKVLQLYRNYIEHHEDILSELETSGRRNKRFDQVYKDFEAQKVCYLPLNTFLLKPAQRLLHYKLILERLLSHYSPEHPDFRECRMSLGKIQEVTNTFEFKMKHLENLHKLMELQRDLVGIDNVVQNNREFIREGCLQKLSKKGYQQRMFFLFSDMLVYASRTATPLLQFKVHGQLSLRGMIVEPTDAVANSFTIYGGNKCLPLAAGSAEERDKWIEDLQKAVATAKDKGEDKVLYPSLKSNSSSDNLEDLHDEPKTPPSPEKQIQHRANTTMHVCWHRNTSVSERDHSVAVENQLSGYLLRKFKNSNGWQKLWVVFTNFCLFFYKTFQDDFPLASLPLLGYSVTTPTEGDGIHKDYVFKLQFKNHVYFFRAESEYTFERWIEVTGSVTDSAQRNRLYSRLDSYSC